MVVPSSIKIFFMVVLATLSVSAQRGCPSSIQAKDENTEKKRFIVIFDKEVKNAVKDHYEMMKECYQTQVQIIHEMGDESNSTEINQNAIRDFSVDGSIQGYTSYFTPEFAKTVEKMKNVQLVEEERKAQVDEIRHATPQRLGRRKKHNRLAWDIDRIDQAKRPLNGKFDIPDSAGQNVTIFIVDSGILLEHDEFGGRAKFGRSFCKGCKRDDISKHGTFTASVAAGKTVGVARKANIIDARVLNADDEGSTAGMIEALSYVIDQHKKGENKNSVVNMSIRVLPPSRALNHAVKEVTDAGIHVAVSAGNDDQDSSKQSPASAPSAITVGATQDKSDAVTVFSNFGKLVDIFAPGLNVIGASVFDIHGFSISSGTSFSSPLVAGTLALLISKNGNKSPAELTKDLIKLSTKGVITGLKHGSPDAFLRTPAP